MDWMWTETIAVIDSLLFQLVVLLFEGPFLFRISEEQGEIFTLLTEILVGGVTFSIPNDAELQRWNRFQRLQHV